MVYLPLLLAGVERIFRKKRPYLLTAAVFLSAVSNIYFFYMLVMVTVIYTVVRLAVFYRKTPNLRKEGCRLFFRIALASVSGVGLAAVIVLPVCGMILNDARFSSRPALHLFYPLSYYCRLVSVFFSQGNDYWTCMGYAAPALPAVVLLFCRKKNGFLKVLFLAGVVMLLFPVFGWFMNGFSYTVNRWSWAFALLCAFILAVVWPALMAPGRRESRVLAAAVSACFAGCMVLEHSRTAAAFSALCLVLLVVLLPFFFCEEDGVWGRRMRQPAALVLVLASLCVNSFWMNAPGGGNYAAEAWEAAYVFDGLLYNETAAVKDAAAREAAGQGAAVKEAAGQGVAVKEAAEQGAAVKEAAGQGAAVKEAAVQDAAVKDAAGQEAVVKDAAGQGAAVQDAEEPQADGFFRYSGRNLTLNAGILSGMSSTQYYWSLSNPYVSEFRSLMGLGREVVALNYTGYDDRAALAALAAVRYYVVPAWDTAPVPYGYTRVETSGSGAGAGCEVYRNDLGLPLAYTYDGRIPQQTWHSLSAAEKQEAVLQGVVLEDYDGDAREAELLLQGMDIESTVQCSGDNVKLQEHAFVVTAPDASVTFHFDGAADSETYLCMDGLEYQGVPDYDTGDEHTGPFERMKNRLFWKKPDSTRLTFASSDGRQKTVYYYTEEHSCYNGQHDFTVNLGYAQDALSSVTLTFSGTGIYSFDSLQVRCLPVGQYVETLNQRREDVLEHTAVGTDEITGEISLERPKLLCLAVPYSAGWSAYVDGEEARLYRANVMYMALELEAGRHEVKLVYHTPLLREGACLSLAVLLFYMGYLAVCFRRGRRDRAEDKA